MKIAIACPASLPATQFGGIMFLAVDIAREISKLGHDVTIFTTDLDFTNGANKFSKKLLRLESIDGFSINRSHVWFAIKLFFINPSMYIEIKKYNPDIIYTIGLRSFQSFIAWILSKNEKIPLVIADQGGLTTNPFLDKSGFFLKCLYKLQNLFISKIISQASGIIAANEYERKNFETININSNIEIIRNGVNLETLFKKINFKDKYHINYEFILFVGRFSINKGIKTMIDAIKLIKEELESRNTKLIIMGVDFGYQNEMYKLIDDYNLQDRIIVIKNPLRDDVISAYGESKFLLLPSKWELSPLVPLESFAFKKPVISTNTYGIPYTVQNDKNGILVEPDNPSELSNAIIKLLENSELRDRLGSEGYNFVHNECNCITMAKKTLQFFEMILKNQNKYKQK